LYLCWIFLLYFFDLFFLTLLPSSLPLSCVSPNYPGQQLLHIEPAFLPFTLLNVISIWNLLHLLRQRLGVLDMIFLPHVDLPLFIEDVVAFLLL